MPAFRSELILNLGVEGGAADIRREKASDGTWVFFCKTFSGGFDLSEFESAETPRKRLESKTFARLEGALEAFAGGAEWVFYFPTKVHPDFRDEVWELREQSLAKILRSDRISIGIPTNSGRDSATAKI